MHLIADYSRCSSAPVTPRWLGLDASTLNGGDTPGAPARRLHLVDVVEYAAWNTHDEHSLVSPRAVLGTTRHVEISLARIARDYMERQNLRDRIMGDRIMGDRIMGTESWGENHGGRSQQFGNEST
jgi:hypothetical protein